MSGPSFRSTLAKLVRAGEKIDQLEMVLVAGRPVTTSVSDAAWKRFRSRLDVAREVLARPKETR